MNSRRELALGTPFGPPTNPERRHPSSGITIGAGQTLYSPALRVGSGAAFAFDVRIAMDAGAPDWSLEWRRVQDHSGYDARDWYDTRVGAVRTLDPTSANTTTGLIDDVWETVWETAVAVTNNTATNYSHPFTLDATDYIQARITNNSGNAATYAVGAPFTGVQLYLVVIEED